MSRLAHAPFASAVPAPNCLQEPTGPSLTAAGAIEAHPPPPRCPLVYDCIDCRRWSSLDGRVGYCPALDIGTVARGGGCRSHFVDRWSDGTD